MSSDKHLSVPELTNILSATAFAGLDTVILPNTVSLTLDEFKTRVGDETSLKLKEASAIVPNGKLLNYMAGKYIVNLIEMFKKDCPGYKILFLQTPRVFKQQEGTFILYSSYLALPEEEMTKVLALFQQTVVKENLTTEQTKQVTQ